jgi:hypothetical protein
VPSATAVREVESQPFPGERARTRVAPSSEQSRYEPRFRVVARKPPAAARRRASERALGRGVLLSAGPAIVLVFYVLAWTFAMRGAYLRDRYQAQIRTIQTERDDLMAEKRRLQSPGTILARAARELDMRPSGRPEFVQVPTAQRVAAQDVAPNSSAGLSP